MRTSFSQSIIAEAVFVVNNCSFWIFYQPCGCSIID
ncbi:MAG: cyclic lactone autoinducer peptide [Candidatus Obscuribacter sp.]|nr:cyclic lactone autoinducer peptide [Candidatus Obscuribacter sp.]